MRIILLILISFLFISSCKKGVLFTGDILVSEVKDKTNYQAPLIIENDYNDKIILNNTEINFKNGIFELTDAGFYEMIFPQNDTILFVLLDKEREETEWGLKKWIPVLPKFDTKIQANCTFIYPKQYYPGILVPVVVKQGNWNYTNVDYWQGTIDKGETFNFKKGIASFSKKLEEKNNIELDINGKNTVLTLNKIDLISIRFNSIISTNIVVDKNSIVQIDADLKIESPGSITFNEGCLIMLNEGVNINNNGTIIIKGSESNPVLFTCSKATQYWGGFISDGEKATIQAKYCFFNRFANHSSSEYQYGHAKHQALFKSSDTNLTFDNCWFIDTHGQVFYTENCELNINNCIVQRAKTSGQINNSNLYITNSYFSDFPDDTQDFADNDNDALYINGSNANISKSVFMYAKDDGIDSGGGEGGEITIKDSWIESCFHEGLALSSNEPNVKTHVINNCIVCNCQQGIELGYSSSNHNVSVINCNVYENYVGIRYGDNYDWNVNGNIIINKSNIHSNYHNTWNMVHQIWGPKPANMFIEN